MFGQLKGLVFRGTAGSVTPSRANNRTKDAVLRPQQRMMRAKRKRGIADDDKYVQNASDTPVFHSNEEPEGERPAKKARIGNANSAILTPVPKGSPERSDGANKPSDDPPSRKRRRSYSDEHEDTPLKRMRRDWDAMIARPQLDGGSAEENGEAVDDAPSAGLTDDQSVMIDDDPAFSASDSGTPSTGCHEVAPKSLSIGLRNIARQHPPATASKPDVAKTSLRRQAKRCQKRILAEQKGRGAIIAGDGEENEEVLMGVGSWPDSAVILGGGGLLRVEEDDRIELPRRKPRKVDWARSLAREETSYIRRAGRSVLAGVEEVAESQEQWAVCVSLV